MTVLCGEKFNRLKKYPVIIVHNFFISKFPSFYFYFFHILFFKKKKIFQKQYIFVDPSITIIQKTKDILNNSMIVNKVNFLKYMEM